MELRQLRSFLVLAEELNVGRAARRLYLSQPAVSRQLQAIEREAGTPLFVRSSRALVLTDAGQLLLAHARRIVQASDELAGLVEQLHRRREVVLLVEETVPAVVAVDIARRLHADQPDLLVRIRHRPPPADPPVEPIGKLARFSRDLPEGTAAEVLWTEPQVAVLPPGHPLAGRARLHRSDLAGCPVLTLPGEPGVRRWLLVDADSPALPTRQTGDTPDLLAAVAAGAAVAVLPTTVAAGYAAAGLRHIPLPGAPPSQVVLLWRRGEQAALMPALHAAARAAGRDFWQATVAATPPAIQRPPARPVRPAAGSDHPDDAGPPATAPHLRAAAGAGAGAGAEPLPGPERIPRPTVQ